MDMLQLYYFQTAAREGNFTRAAEKLLVSQPALSKMIKNLEDEMGSQLFDRTGRNVYLNDNGRIMLSYADKILHAAEDVKKEIKDNTVNSKGQCKFSMTAATRLLPQLVLKFKESNPNIDIVCTQENHNDANPTNDLYIYSSRVKEEGTVLLKEECVLCVWKNHKLAKKNYIDQRDTALLKNNSFLVIQNKMPTYRLTKELCEKAGFEPHISLECDSSETIFSLIEAEMGIAVVPFVTWRNSIIVHNVSVIRIGSDFCRYIMLKERPGRYISRPVKIFRNFVTEFFQKIESQEKLLNGE